MNWIVGIDEVGRGPIAGPITVGVVGLPQRKAAWKFFKGLKDSKKLSEKKRSEWNVWVRAQKNLCFAVASVSAQEIDRIGIVAAGNLAARRALAKLNLDPAFVEVQLDHGLKVGKEWTQKAYVKGDERFPAIALASIVAKVHRDAYMTRLGKKFPGYGFEIHKGYGTRAHYKALRAGKRTSVHRVSFCDTIKT